jgi:hypothetical protein
MRRIPTAHLPGPQNPGMCHLYLAEGCHLYIAPTSRCGKVEIWKKLPQNRLQAEIQILLNQWVTNIVQPVTGSESAISRLFPHPVSERS